MINSTNHDSLRAVGSLVGSSEGVRLSPFSFPLSSHSSFFFYLLLHLSQLEIVLHLSQPEIKRKINGDRQVVLPMVISRTTDGAEEQILHLRLTPSKWDGRGLLGCHIVLL